MRRLVGLLRNNQKGPWLYIGDFVKPLLHVEGAAGELTVEYASAVKAEESQKVAVAGNGRHPLPAAKYCRISRDHKSEILCIITSG